MNYFETIELIAWPNYQHKNSYFKINGDIMKWKYGLLSFLIFISCIIPTSADTTVFYDENDEGLSYYEFDSAVNNFLQPKYLNNISTLAKSLNGSDIEETTWNIAIWESDNIEYNFTKANLTQPTFTYYYDNGSLINITVENPDNFTLQTPEQTINLKSGICSDYTLLTAGLLLADGYQPVYIFDLNASDNKPGHVFCAIKINNTFYAIDQSPPIQEVDYHIYLFEKDYNLTTNHVEYYEIAIDNGTTVVNKYNYTYNNNSIQFGGFNELPYLEYKTNIILNQSKVVDGNLYNLTNISTSVEASGYNTYTIKAKYDDVFEDEWAKYLINKSEIFDTNWERYYAHVYEDGENIIINITIANVSDDLAVAPIPVPTTEEETVNVKYINSLPYTINQSGYYILNTTCTNLTTTAITIDVDNVVLDGNGKVLDGNNTEYTYGVYVNNGKNITIKNLTIREFMCGISLDSSSNNTIASVNALNNVKGIFLTDSSNNIIANNTFENCGLFVEDSYNNIIENNTVNGKLLVYLENENDELINNAGQVIALNCNNITVKDVSLNNASVGIEFISVSNSTITNVNASNNGYGIYISSSSNNIIYLNNLINNSNNIRSVSSFNTFHSPTPTTYIYNGTTYTNYTGNYYSNYTGNDSDGNGIGDTPYIIDSNNNDSYPLIAPIENYIIDNTPPTVVINTPQNTSYNVGTVPQINTTVNDDVGVDTVVAEIHYANGTVENITLTLQDGNYINTTELNFPVGTNTIVIYANDTSGNLNNTENVTFTVVDNEPPTVVINTPQNTSYNVGTVPQINTTVNDDVGVDTVVAEIHYANGTIENITLTLQGGNYINNTPLNFPVGTHTIVIYANDTSGNLNNTENVTFTVTSSSSSSTTTTTIHHSSSRRSSHHYIITTTEETYPDVAKDIESEKIREFIHNAKLIVGSEIDNDLSAKYLKNETELIHQPLEIKEDCILIGGPVANPLVKKYQWAFPIKITNDYPGKNKGVIQKQIINGHLVTLLAGSDRWGTKAAVEYFKTLDDIPDEPIFVEWRDGKAIKIEKP